MNARRKKLLGITFLALVWLILLAGWGLDDLPGFFAHPARAGVILGGVVGLVLAALLRIEFEPFRKGTRPVGSQRRWMLFAGLLLFCVTAWLPYSDRRGILVFQDTGLLRYSALVLLLMGVSLRLAGLAALGRQFSGYVTLQDDHRLVQTGVYSVFRHPMYLGGLLGWGGMGVVFRSYLVLPLLWLAGLFIFFRIRQEERLLGEQFGAEFDAYRRRTWRLIPGVF